jgi:hypothetical protein
VALSSECSGLLMMAANNRDLTRIADGIKQMSDHASYQLEDVSNSSRL